MSVKKILYGVLQDALGDYIEGLTPESLRLGLWSGKIELRDLRVNTKAVEALGLPVRIDAGSIGRLSIAIPWSSLGSTPVRVAIEDISVTLCAQSDAAALAPETLQTLVEDALSAQLARADAACRRALEARATQTDPGYVRRLAAKIVDNLEVTIRNVSMQVAAGGHACSVRIRSLAAQACDGTWTPAFVERATCRGLLRNAVTLDGFGIRWDRDDDVLEPVSCALRLTRNPACAVVGAPQYDVELKVDGVRCAIKAKALRGSTRLVDALTLAARRQNLLDQHPAYIMGRGARPITSQNARCWWRYAARLACPALDAKRRASQALLGLARFASEREGYLAALRKGDEETARRIERRAPFEALRLWRRDAVVASVERERAAAAKKNDKAHSGWFGWRKNSDDAFEEGGSAAEDVTVTDIEELMSRDDEGEAPIDGEFLRVRCSATLACKVDDLATLALGGSIDARASTGFASVDVTADLAQFSLADDTGSLKRSGVASGACIQRRGDAPLRVVLAKVNERTAIEVTGASYDVAYHKPWLGSVLEALTSDATAKAARAAAEQARRYRSLVTKAAEGVLGRLTEAQAFAWDPAQRTLCVTVDMGAPTILVPRAWAGDAGLLIIDTGSISVDGGLASNGQRWDVALHGATARLEEGDSKRDIVLAPLRLDLRVDLPAGVPLDAAVTLGGASFGLAPDDLRDVLSVAAAIMSEQEAMVEVGATAPATAAPVGLRLRVAAPLFELAILNPDRSRRMVLSLTSLEASLVSGASGMTLNALVGGVNLADAQRKLIESRGDATAQNAMALARTAFGALPSPPKTTMQRTNEAVLAVRFRTFANKPEEGFHSDIDVEFATLVLAVGAADLKPLEPFFASLREGLAGFASSVSQQPLPQSIVSSKKTRVSLKLGELALTLRNDDGDVATAAIIGLGVMWTKAEDTQHAFVRLAKINVADARRSSEGNFFRQMVVPWTPSEDARGVSLKRLVGSAAQMQLPASDLLLAVDYSDTNGKKTVSLTARPLSVQLLLEPIGAAVDAALTAVRQVVVLAVTQEATSEAAPSTNGSMAVRVEVRACEVLLVEDAASSTSRMLALRTGVGFEMDSKDDQRFAEQCLKVSVRDVEAALVQGPSAKRILEPTSLVVQVERRFASSELYDWRVAGDVSVLNLRLSYRDLLSVAAIARAAPHAGSTDPIPEEAAPSKAGRVVTAALKFNLEGINVQLVDDAKGPAAPLVDLSLAKLATSLSGPTTDLQGSVKTHVEARAFDLKCLRFEPLLEAYALTCAVTVNIQERSWDVACASQDILDAVLSTAFAARLIRLQGNLARDLARGAAGAAAQPAFALKNETGAPLDVRVSTQWTRVDAEASFALGGSSNGLDTPKTVECRLPGGRILPALPCCRPAAIKLEAGLAWSCAFDDRAGRVVGRLRRRAVVTNRTDLSFDVAAAVEGYGDAEVVLCHSGETPLPPAIAGGAFRLRRSGTQAWGRQTVGSSDGKIVVDFEGTAVVAHSTHDAGEPAIVLHAPLIVENRLPCGILVRVQAKAREGRCRVAPGSQSTCCSVDVQEGCYIALRVGNLRGRLRKRLATRDLPNRATAASQSDLQPRGFYEVALQEDGVDVLAVAIRAEKRHRGLGLFLVIEAPLWVVDRTGLNLDLAAAPGGSLLPPGLARKASEMHRVLTGGSSRNSFAEPGDAERSVATEGTDLVRNVSVASARLHVLAPPATRGDRLYADSHAYVFVALPPPLQSCIRLVTHDAHKAQGSQASQLFGHAARSVGENTASFLLGDDQKERFLHIEGGGKGLDLYVATDCRINRPPAWLADAFERCAEPLVAEKVRGPLDFGGQDQRLYDVWVRRLVKDEAINLGPNEQKTHYLVFLGEGTGTISRTPDSLILGDWAVSWPGYSWADPQIHGRRLLAARDSSLSVGCRGAWSGRYAVGASEFPLVVDCADGRRLDLEARPHALGGAFGKGGGRSVEVAPRVALRNVDAHVQILVRRENDANTETWLQLTPEAKQATPWHWPASRELLGGNVVGRVQFGIGGHWSAPVPLDRVAGHALFVKGADLVIRVEIRANDDIRKPPHEAVTVRCAVDRVNKRPLFVVRNVSQVPLQVKHASEKVAVLAPNQAKVIGFVDVDRERTLEVISPTAMDSINVGCVSGPLSLARGSLDARVALEDGARVLIVSDAGAAFEENDDETEACARRALSLNLGGVSLHIIDGAGQSRREVLSVNVRGVTCSKATEGTIRETEVKVAQLQIDQFAPDAAWPVLLRGVSSPVFEAASASEGNTLRYLAAKLLPLEARADTTSLRALGRVWTSLSDARTDAVDHRVSTDPGRWAEALLFDKEAPESCMEARQATFEPRGVVDALVLHPVQLEASFSPVAMHDDDGDAAIERVAGLSALSNLAEIDRADVQLKSFAVEKAVEEPGLLAKTIRRHYVVSLLQQLHRVVGSLASIGQPLNLVSTIGGGVKEFFYEPSKGIVESPTAFAKGAYKGTSALTTSVVGGFATSIGGVGGVLANNASLLAGDASYSQQRDARRRASKGADMANSAASGAESVVRGIGEGVAGVFLQPVRGARKGGVGGFFKGVARGVAGVVVKPVVGVLDGATQVIEGVGTVANGGAAKGATHVAPALQFVRLPDSEEVALRGTQALG